MKLFTHKLKTMHPLSAIAAIGGILFVAGGLTDYANTVPHALMWLGGGMVFVSFVMATS